MAHTYIEIQYDSRKFSVGRTSIRQTFTIVAFLDPDVVPENDDLAYNGAYDDIQAIEYAYTLFSEYRSFPDYNGKVQVCVLDDVSAENVGPDTWKFEGSYIYDANSGQGGESPSGGAGEKTLPFVKYGFTIGNGSRLIKRSISSETPVLSSDSKLTTAVDNKGALNVVGNVVNGLEIPDAQFRLQITAYYFPTIVTMDFGNTIADLINGPLGYGTYNDDTFLGRPAGEVQLVGASGGGTVLDIIPITFEFSIKKNITNQADTGFANLTMLGHDHLEYYWKQDVDIPNGAIRLIADQRQVHKVAEPVDYTVLAFPTRTQYEAQS